MTTYGSRPAAWLRGRARYRMVAMSAVSHMGLTAGSIQTGEITMQLHSRTEVLLRVVVLIIACASATGSTAFASSNPADPLATLAIWQGHWQEVVVTKATPYSTASSVPLHVTCSWTPHRGYMLCEYSRDRGDAKQLIASDHLSIFTYDDATKSYKHLGVSKDYRTLEEMIVIDGSHWQYRYQLPGSDGAMLDLRDSYDFVNPDERITRTEISSDHGRHWILLSESVGRKVG
jgi:hypothetical protein